jgi:hypothetical protein
VYVAGQDEYLASEQNGVTSYDWGSWDLSFTFAAPIACDTNAIDVGVEGDQFAVTCPAACDAGSVWGTGSYSTDSSICTAAAHAGVISLETGGTFLLELTAGQETYPASEQNGIASSEWGAWDLSMVPRSLEMVQLSCDATASQYEGESGESFTAVCPAACAAGSIWGTNVYTDDSNICTAAAHAGAITLEEGGTVVVTFAEGKESYSATVENGIESSSWGAWSRSFIIGQ